MPRTRPAYPPEWRRKLVELAHAGRTVSSLAREYEPTETTIRNWIRQAERDAPPSLPEPAKWLADARQYFGTSWRGAPHRTATSQLT
jgi:transposase-like protein